ncbi:MAG TPA: cobalamin biosynthesis protein [Methanothrix sp.]|mgnify:FL=1|jgi:adenosylcobinamide-phosphate synthase|uniref:cobalamin biosynthesis protein n=1 Tax=Methanothrix sp. TaxID=90426 RepID=UPI002BFF2532|nr:cobalamin biosynthesis protein [Methanothrix sp.]MDI9416848.1 cobalamin biosynthesis protein [Euryarchaeota archaeon]HON35693.1 cobalamin biosynthesis protein [Methanothrix sp.]HRU75023.1 cobalamin biosynthesis protein [Methanothrix sp.]
MTLTIPEGLAVFLLAAAFDILIGEPPVRIHPVVWIGRLISSLRSLARPSMMQGILLAVIVIAASVLSAHLLVEGARAFPVLPLLVGAYLLKSTFAIRCLLETSSSIGRMVDQDIEEAKKMLPALVGRETGSLSPAQVSSAVIESLSENYVDSILTPIFYYVLLSPLGLGLEAAMAFKAISTMDSMIGYKKPGLKELGFAGARLDDLANWIPARMSLILIALARPGGARDAIRGAWKYHRATPSPNSGWPMAAAAGSLKIRLEKPGQYVLLEENPEPGTGDILRATALMQSAIALTMLAAIILLFLYSS